MGITTKIPWADSTWNWAIGCSHAGSPGCDHCYARGWAKRCGRDFSKVVRAATETFHAPLKWKDPKRIFVCSLSDFFHPDIVRKDRHDAIHVMRHAPQHTYMLLTKRPENVRPMLLGTDWGESLPNNVWLGVTVENQEQADRRIPLLLSAPATTRFISCEPLLGPVDLNNLGFRVGMEHLNALTGDVTYVIKEHKKGLPSLDWVIAGCESGGNRRPMDTAWVRKLRNDCAVAGVPFFYKQGVVNGKVVSMPQLDGDTHDAVPRSTAVVKEGI